MEYTNSIRFINFNKIKIFLKILLIYLFFTKNPYNLKKNYHLYTKKLSTNKENDKNNSKICICTTGKEENRYIREFLLYYEKYGVDKIFLYDNNNINGENFDDIIKDFINKGFVEIFNWRGKNKTGYTLRNDCYIRNKKKFDWLIFYDIDEYIYLKNYTNIKNFLNEKKFKKCLKINLNWVIHTDNNLIYYENKTLHERFPEIEQDAKKNIPTERYFRFKFILRGRSSNHTMNYNHLISKDVRGCNGNGKKSKLLNDKYMANPDFRNYYIDHYYFKSIQEFTEKINKGDNYLGYKICLKIIRLKRFFKYNKITLGKIKFIEKNTGINFKEIQKKLNKKLNIKLNKILNKK